MALFSLSLFGSFDVCCNGQPVDLLRLEKEQALLAYLAVEGHRAQRREVLATLLWPEASEAVGRANLRQVLHRLRFALGDLDKESSLLHVSPQHIQLTPDETVSVDVCTFANLLNFCRTHKHASLASCQDCIVKMRAAIALYRGEFLEDWHLPDSVLYQDWVTFKQAELHNLAVTTLSFLARWHEQHGEYEYADGFIQQQLRLEPWSEDAHRARMNILAAGGKRTSALKQFADCRRMLAHELGIEPSSETLHLYQRLQQDGASDRKQAERDFANLAGLYIAADTAIAQGNPVLADELIDQLAVLAQHANNSEMLWLAKGLAGINEFFCGDLAWAQSHLEHVVNADASQLSAALLPLTGVDFLVLCTHWLSWVHYIRGNAVQADVHARAALARAEFHPFTQAVICVLAQAAVRCLGDYPRPECTSPDSWPAVVPGNLALHHLEDLRTLLADASGAACNSGRSPQMFFSSAPSTGVGPELVLLGLIWAERYAAVESSQSLLLHISRLLKQIDDSGTSVFTAELYRLRGQAFLTTAQQLTGRPELQHALNEEGEISLRIAIDLAHTQHLGLWELRATTAICRHLQQTGRTREAFPLLTMICSRFPAECSWQDLRIARNLLQSISDNM